MTSVNGAGSIKRWGMKRGLMTHGSKSKRQHGSIGASATPSRVLPGLKMAGQMGNSRVKIRKVKVGTLGRQSAGSGRRLGCQPHVFVTPVCGPVLTNDMQWQSSIPSADGVTVLMPMQADARRCNMH